MPFLDLLVAFCNTFSLVPSRYKLLLRAAHGDVSLPLRTAVPSFAFPYLYKAPLSHCLHLLTPAPAQESRPLPVPCSEAKSQPPGSFGSPGPSDTGPTLSFLPWLPPAKLGLVVGRTKEGRIPPREGEAARRLMIGVNSCQREGAWSLLFLLWEDRSCLPGRGAMKAVGCQPVPSIVSTGPSAYASEQERRQHCMRHPHRWPLTLSSPLLRRYTLFTNLFIFFNTSLNCSFGLMVVETSLSSTKRPLLAHHPSA